jgi:hypothetical protein
MIETKFCTKIGVNCTQVVALKQMNHVVYGCHKVAKIEHCKCVSTYKKDHANKHLWP